MPYVNDHARDFLRSIVSELRGVSGTCHTPGDLNYLFTQIAIAYLQVHGTNYQRINDVLGALEGAKLEFYRRVAAYYEDTKIHTNGDVYPPNLAPEAA